MSKRAERLWRGGIMTPAIQSRISYYDAFYGKSLQYSPIQKQVFRTMILHIPHSSRSIPEELRCQFVLSDTELERELTYLTDAYTDELFNIDGAVRLVFPISRLVVDVERFLNDADEPMSKVGMGAIYSTTALGSTLRRALAEDERARMIARYYASHHVLLGNAVDSELREKGKALIIDCHSFPSSPLPCENNQTSPRSEVCIGTDDFHTPKPLISFMTELFASRGYTVDINHPYQGAVVPEQCNQKDKRVISVMIEIRRDLYMNELTSEKSDGFDKTRFDIQWVLSKIMQFKMCSDYKDNTRLSSNN